MTQPTTKNQYSPTIRATLKAIMNIQREADDWDCHSPRDAKCWRYAGVPRGPWKYRSSSAYAERCAQLIGVEIGSEEFYALRPFLRQGWNHESPRSWVAGMGATRVVGADDSRWVIRADWLRLLAHTARAPSRTCLSLARAWAACPSIPRPHILGSPKNAFGIGAIAALLWATGALDGAERLGTSLDALLRRAQEGSSKRRVALWWRLTRRKSSARAYAQLAEVLDIDLSRGSRETWRMSRLSPAFARWVADWISVERHRRSDLPIRMRVATASALAHSDWMAAQPHLARLRAAYVPAWMWYAAIASSDHVAWISVEVAESGADAASIARILKAPAGEAPRALGALKRALGVASPNEMAKLALWLLGSDQEQPQHLIERLLAPWPGDWLDPRDGRELLLGTAPLEIAEMRLGADHGLSRQEAHRWLMDGGRCIQDWLRKDLGLEWPHRSKKVLRWLAQVRDRGDSAALTRVREQRMPGEIEPRRYRFIDLLDEVQEADIITGRDSVQAVFRRAAERNTAAYAAQHEHDHRRLADPPAWCARLPRAVRALTTRASLVEEGAALRHCVGGYSQAVERRESVILSLITAAGRSTAEVTYDGAAVRQHRGISNGEPPRWHARLLSALMSRVRRRKGALVGAGGSL